MGLQSPVGFLNPCPKGLLWARDRALDPLSITRVSYPVTVGYRISYLKYLKTLKICFLFSFRKVHGFMPLFCKISKST